MKKEKSARGRWNARRIAPMDNARVECINYTAFHMSNVKWATALNKSVQEAHKKNAGRSVKHRVQIIANV